MTRIASHPVKLDWTKIKAMVFDLDNTLISSQLNFVWLREQIGCPPQRDVLDYVDELPHQQAQKAHQIVVDHELDDARHSALMPGAKALLNVLAHEQHHVAIITRNCQAAAKQT
ncbi:HAD family hydrolase [Vibrio olivae]